MRRLTPAQTFAAKVGLFLLLLAPALVAAARLFAGEVAEPGDYLTHVTGEWSLRLLLLTLLVTPLVNVTGWTALMKFRRMIGLFAFFYVFLHFEAYLLLDVQLDFPYLIEDVVERKYITIGFAAFVLLIPLAVTSNDFLLKKMGARRWQKLHRLVYAIMPLGILHFWLQIKNEAAAEPLVYLALTALLLAARAPAVAAKLKKRR